MERVTRLLYALTAVLLLIGLGWRVLPPPAAATPQPGTPAVMPGPEIRRLSAPTPETEAAIISANPFSISRSPPRVRYSPPDLKPGTRETPRPQINRSARRPRLLGTVVGPTGTAAIIDAGRAGGAELYQIGDVVAGRRVMEVAESTVVLQGAAGRVVLRLQSVAPSHR